MGRTPHGRARTRSFAFSMVLALIASSLGGILGDVGRADALPGPVEQIDVNPAGDPGDQPSHHPALSADGRFVAFQSFATNLVAGDTNNEGDIFVRDRLLGTTERVSLTSAGNESSNGGCSSVGLNSAISADGRFVAFDACDSLVPGAPVGQVYVRDRQAGTTELVSGGGGPGVGFTTPAISADGRFVTYYSAAPTGTTHVIRYDRQTSASLQVDITSTGASSTGVSNACCFPPSLSDDGRFVVFPSAASDLVPADTNNDFDVFVRDVVAGTTTRVSVNGAGTGGNDWSYGPVISADGSLVSFVSEATNLVTPPPTLGLTYGYVHNLVSGATTLESVAPGTNGRTASYLQLSANGRFLTWSDGINNEIWVRDRQTAATTQTTATLSTTPELAISGNGHRVVYTDGAPSIYSVPSSDDTTDPSVTLLRPAEGAIVYVGQSITASYSCADEPGGSGVESCVGTVPDGSAIDTSLGTHSFSVTATDAADNTTTVTHSYTVVPPVDSTAPTIVSAAPVDAAVYAPGQSVLASYSCADNAGGSGIASCVGTVANGAAIDTSTPGTQAFEVTATDVAGNDTHVIRHYVVGGPGPVVAIYSPASSGEYAVGQVVAADYSCSPAPGGAAVASCDGSVPVGDPISTTFGFHLLSVTATDVLGRETTETVAYHVYVLASASATLPPEGGTVMTNDTPTPAAPFGTVVTSPNGGAVSIVDQVQGSNPPTGYTALGAQVLITAPPAARENPLVLTFYGEGTALPPGIDQSNIQLSKDGVLLTNCLGATTVPVGVTACISGRDPAPSGGGDIRITVISISASQWSLAVPLPAITGGVASVAEGNSGTRVLNVPVTLARASDRAVSMHWATAGVTATSGVDFVAGSGTVTFLRGETRKTVPVVVKGDVTVELDESFRVNVSSPNGATIGTPAFATGTIVDDDRPAFSVNDVSVTEGNTGTKAMKFTVTLSKALTQTATVVFATANGSARTVVDYAATVGTLTFKAGKVSLTVKVSIVGDKVHEPNETLFLKLSKASSNTRIADASGTGTIVNND